LLIDSFADGRSLDDAIADADSIVTGRVTAQYLDWTGDGDRRAEVLVSEIAAADGVERLVQWISLDCMGDGLGLGYAPLVRPLASGREYTLPVLHDATTGAWKEIDGFTYEVLDGGRIAAWNEYANPDADAPRTVGELRARFDEAH
jgi:hypothetical protein